MALQFFIKNLCLEIKTECKKLEISCHQNFLTYYLNLLAYDPLWNLYPKMKEIDRHDALRLINFVVHKMEIQQCASMITLKIQFYFRCNFENKMDIVAMHLGNLHVRLKPLLEEIVESQPDTEAGYELLLKQMIYYTTIWCGLGNPLHEEVYKEAYHAMVSIFDDSDMKEFIKHMVEEKLLYISDLAKICAGVRIFNWTCEKGGAGIKDLPKYLEQNLEELKEDLTKELESTMNKLDILTTAVDLCFVIEENDLTSPFSQALNAPYRQTCVLPPGLEYEEIEHYKDMIINCRQRECFYRQLLNVTNQIQHNSEALALDFKECIDGFHSLTHMKAGVPTRVIFPMFIDIDIIWMSYQKEIMHMHRTQAIMQDLNFYCRDLPIQYDKLQELIGDMDILNDEDRTEMVEESEYLDADLCNVDVFLPDSNEFKKLDEMNFEFSGFDVWRMVESQGALIPGNPNLGVIQYDNRHYIFTCKKSAYMFAQHPDRVVNEALELARKQVTLINLMHLNEDLEKVQTVKQLSSDTGLFDARIAQSNVSQQTETHPLEPHKDPQYKWNVWDYKRKALHDCNVSAAKTTQTVTEVTLGKQGAGTQTYESREVALQTLRDNYTNTHTPLTYFFGLRGRKDDQQFILDLTKPPEKS